MFRNWLDKWFPVMWFFGLKSGEVCETRFGAWNFPLWFEWKHAVGPFHSREEAERRGGRLKTVLDLSLGKVKL